MLEAVQMMRAASSPQAASPHAGTVTPPTLIDLANEFLVSKARAGRSDNYLICLSP